MKTVKKKYRSFFKPTLIHFDKMSKLLKYEGFNYLRQRLILATLSGKPVRIEKIRSDDENPGLRGEF